MRHLIKLAGAAALAIGLSTSGFAAEKLKGGPLADAIDINHLTGPTSLVKQFYASSPRVGDMLRVIDALK